MKSRRGECVKVLAGMDALPGALLGGAMPITAEVADVLWQRCLMANAGFLQGLSVWTEAWNSEWEYRVLARAEDGTETDLVYSKLTGGWLLMIDGREVSVECN